jgi:hypothetical protein
VKNQGSCGSCYIFASLGAFESAYLIANKLKDPGNIEVSEQEILDCGIAETNCVVGGWHEYVFTYLWTLGAVASASYSYNTDSPQRGVYCVSDWGTRPYFLRNWNYVSAADMIPKPLTLKQAILAKGPLVSGVSAISDGSPHDWDYYSGGVLNSIPSTGNPQDVKHEVVIVGWDDELQGEGFPAGAWIVKNSWGTTWGGSEQGYVKIPYAGNNIGFGASWVSAFSKAAVASLTATAQLQKN